MVAASLDSSPARTTSSNSHDDRSPNRKSFGFERSGRYSLRFRLPDLPILADFAELFARVQVIFGDR
jgi:hypothetical protein